VVAKADIVFWPVAMDIKYKDVEAMPDKSIDVASLMVQYVIANKSIWQNFKAEIKSACGFRLMRM
jgi:hypothetical protein